MNNIECSFVYRGRDPNPRLSLMYFEAEAIQSY
jgi:hypothetical protein